MSGDALLQVATNIVGRVGDLVAICLDGRVVDVDGGCERLTSKRGEGRRLQQLGDPVAPAVTLVAARAPDNEGAAVA